MHKLTNLSSFAILSSILVTIFVFPPLMDPINTPKLWILAFGAGVTAFLTLRNAYKKNTLKIDKKVLFLIIISKIGRLIKLEIAVDTKTENMTGILNRLEPVTCKIKTAQVSGNRR